MVQISKGGSKWRQAATPRKYVQCLLTHARVSSSTQRSVHPRSRPSIARGIYLPSFRQSNKHDVYGRLAKKTVIEKPNGEREEKYEYAAVINDPEMLQLNREQLCDEAIYKRQLVVSTMNQMVLCMDDYQKAEAGAAGAENSRFSMAY